MSTNLNWLINHSLLYYRDMKNVKIDSHSKATKNSTKFWGWIMKNNYTNFFVLLLYYSTDQYKRTHCGVSVDYYNVTITIQNCINNFI